MMSINITIDNMFRKFIHDHDWSPFWPMIEPFIVIINLINHPFFWTDHCQLNQLHQIYLHQINPMNHNKWC